MVMSAAEVAQMSRLLDEALCLDAEGRRRWLEQLSPQHRELAAALRDCLLARPDTDFASVMLDTLPKIAATPDDPPPALARLRSGEQVGPYRLVRLLGTGGMAEVWLAQRADGAFEREVALKVPALSWRRPDLLQRFARERDILAGLEHANIARLYDAGVSSCGLPYLAMEYVPGEPLIRWCDARQSGLRERVKLFLQVLDAVQYAHSHRVVHRDLKPSNVLVTPSGQVRLLDFGVAKRLTDRDQPQLTQLYGRALTPDYASPELVRGESVGTVSDVYSLGVMLYELLTGNKPYQIKAGASATSLEKEITTACIERPSTQLALKAGTARATTQEKLTRQLRGDLDAIVLKALAVTPQGRYASASALADDLRRHLSGESVEARPDRLTYRAGKFLLRHRGGIAAAALAVLAGAGMALIRAPAAAPANAGTSMVRVSDQSIGVLPFVDISEKKDQEYFADGLTAEILGLLSRVPELHVPARTSSFYFKGRQSTIADISHALGVTHVLEGSVRKSGSHLRVSAQLVRADNGDRVWSESYDRHLDDMFQVQDEIAGAVVGALRASLLARAAPQVPGTANTDAYTLYRQGRLRRTAG